MPLSQGMLEVEVTLTEGDFGQKIYRELADLITSEFVAQAGSLRMRVRQIVEEGIRSSPTTDALKNGYLRGEMGLATPDSALEQIVAAVGESVEVLPLPPAGGLDLGGCRVQILPGTTRSLLALDAATFSYTSRRRGPTTIPWLDWLLHEGSGPVVLDARFAYIKTPASRTGWGIMIPGGQWSVPSEFGGTVEDNWLTRAMAAVEEAVTLAMGSFLTRVAGDLAIGRD